MTRPEFIPNTWREGYLSGKCQCGYTFSVTTDEFSNEVDAREALKRKFDEHVREKHSG